MPSTSGPHTKRRVRLGRGSIPSVIKREMIRADSRMVTHPLLRYRSRRGVRDRDGNCRSISPKAGSLPGMMPVTTVQCPGPTSALTFADRTMDSPATKRARKDAAVSRETMKANPSAIRGFRWPHRTKVRSSPDHAELWFGISLTMPAAPCWTTPSCCTRASTPSARTIFPRTSLPA